MKLVDLQNKAIEGCTPIGGCYDPETGELTDVIGKPIDQFSEDSLEQFIASKIAETYDPFGSDLRQVKEARRTIEDIIEDLQGVANALFRLEHEVEAEE